MLESICLKTHYLYDLNGKVSCDQGFTAIIENLVSTVC